VWSLPGSHFLPSHVDALNIITIFYYSTERVQRESTGTERVQREGAYQVKRVQRESSAGQRAHTVYRESTQYTESTARVSRRE
jgi:hypothetical protein